jgi:hypothetical protein
MSQRTRDFDHLRPVRTHDERGRYYTVADVTPTGPTRDRVLEAVPPGKVCALGRVWAGDLKPLLDSHVESVRPLVSGFTLGQVLTAEPCVPRGQELSTGRTWGTTRDYVEKVADAMRKQIRERAAEDDDTDDPVDLTAVMDAIGELEAQARSGLPHAVHAAINGVRDAIANARPASRRTTAAPVRFADNGGTPLPEGGMTRSIRDFREGRTIDSRARGKMQQANEAARRARAAERRQVETETPWPPDAA